VARLLVVEDDPGIAGLVDMYLRRAGYLVEHSADGAAALRWFALHGPTVDLVVLDLMLPGLDGRGLCRRIRDGAGNNPRVPVLMLTALDDTRDRLEGFALGADDYLVKPFEPAELVARIGAILRRSKANPTAATTESDRDPGEARRLGRASLDRPGRRLLVDGCDVPLRPREFDLLDALSARPGVVFSRDLLVDRVWKGEANPDSRTVDVHVSRLRDRLDAAASGLRIEAVRGVGYRLELTTEPPG
jgi:DNA-binding response OmpR family regulator